LRKTRAGDRCWWQLGARYRQLDAKGGAGVRLRPQPDSTAVFLHDGIRDCQTKPGTLADFLCGEERVEDLRLHLFRDARSVVVDLEYQTLPLEVVPGAYDY